MTDTVYLDYDQRALDRSFDQRAWARNASEVLERHKVAGKILRDGLTLRADQPYGLEADERLDVYVTHVASAPIHMHVHGGAWRWLCKGDVGLSAPLIIAGGRHFIAPDFSALPDATLPAVVEQLARAVAWVYENAKDFGGDRERIFISGHSSGAHLCAVLLATDMTRYGLPADVLKGGICISGIFDMEPVLLSARGSYVKLTRDESEQLSPVRQVHSIKCPVSVVYAEGDSPEFIRQSKQFHAALTMQGTSTELIEVSGVNHFEVSEALGSLVFRCIGSTQVSR